MNKDRSSESAKSFARAEASSMKDDLNLSQDQQAAVVSVLSKLGPGDSLATDVHKQLDARLRVLESILTAEQLQTYRQQKLQEIESDTKIGNTVKALLGK